MSLALGWLGLIAIWIAVTLGARGLMKRFGWLRCSVGDWGTAFLLGFTLYSILVYLAALVGIRIGAPVMIAAAGVVLAAGWGLGGRTVIPRPKTAPWSPAERVTALFLCILAGALLLNALYFPVAATDAHSYDGRARYLIHDGTLDLGLYHWPGYTWTGKINITYPPLYSLGLATTYAFGGWQSNLLSGLMSITWLLMLFGELRQHLPRFAALFWIFLVGLTPEVLSHASYALLNVPAMALLLGETLGWIRFLVSKDRRWLVFAGLFAAGATGVRSDALVLHTLLGLGTLVAALLDSELRHTWLRWMSLAAAAALAPLLTVGTWAWYLHEVVSISTLTPFAAEYMIGWKLASWALYRISTHPAAFGPLFAMWAVASLLFFVFRVKGARGRGDRTALYFHGATFLILGSIVCLYAGIDREFGGGYRDVLNSSMKRAVFYAVPMAAAAIALSPPFSWINRWGGGWLHGERSDGPLKKKKARQ